MTSIEWTKITSQMKVVETKTHFEAAGKLVTWGSRDAKIAQSWLKARARADMLGISRNVITGNPLSTKQAKKHAIIRCKGCLHIRTCKRRGGIRLGTFCSYKETRK